MAQRILALEIADDRIEAALGERAWSSFALLGTYQAQRAEDETDLAPALAASAQSKRNPGYRDFSPAG